MAYRDPFAYPGDLYEPDLVWGMAKLCRGFTGPCVDIRQGGSFANFGLAADSDSLDLDAIGTLLDGNIGRCTQVYPQRGTAHLVGTTSEAFKIDGECMVNGIPALVCDGASSVASTPCWLAADITALNVNAQRHTLVFVGKFTTSLARNRGNALARVIGSVCELTHGGGTVVSHLFADGRETVGFGAGAQDFEHTFPRFPIEVTPSIVMLIRDGDTTWLRQNGVSRRLRQGSAVSALAQTLYLGKRQSSVAGLPGVGGTSDLGDYWWLATELFADRVLTDFEARQIERAYCNRINRSRTIANKSIFVVGASIAAEFEQLGLNGWVTRLQGKLSEQVRFYNFGNPGATWSLQPGSVGNYTCCDGILREVVLQHLRISPQANVVIFADGGNDAIIAPPDTPTPENVGTLELAGAQLCRDAGAAVIVATMTPRNLGTGVQDWCDGLSAALIAGAGDIADVFDAASIPELTPPGTSNGNPYFADDGHLKGSTGGELFADDIAPQVETALGN